MDLNGPRRGFSADAFAKSAASLEALQVFGFGESVAEDEGEGCEENDLFSHYLSSDEVENEQE